MLPDACKCEMKPRERPRRPSSIAIAICLFVLNSGGASAQITVSGRITEQGSGAGVAMARVNVLGVSQTITQKDGAFRFERIAPGRYTVRISALGYNPLEVEVPFRRDTVVAFMLSPRPLLLGSVTVADRISLSGHVVEGATGRRIIDADIIARPIGKTRSGAGGRFRFHDIAPGDTIQVHVEAFGFEPSSARIVLERDTTLVFEMDYDVVGQQMIANQVTLLTQRSRASGFSLDALGRKRIMQSTAATAYDLAQYRLGTGLSRVACIIFDEHRLESADVLKGYPIDMIYRLEVLNRGRMIRLYSEGFVRRMVEGRIVLGPLVFIDGTGRPVCS